MLVLQIQTFFPDRGVDKHLLKLEKFMVLVTSILISSFTWLASTSQFFISIFCRKKVC